VIRSVPGFVGVNISLFHSSSRYQIRCKAGIEMYSGEASFSCSLVFLCHTALSCIRFLFARFAARLLVCVEEIGRVLR